jgi:rhodanese-related sulfurtransferase
MRRRVVLAAAVLVATFAAVTVRAADAPAGLAGAKVVTAGEVIKLAGAGALVVDARIASEYADGHIKGAINVPYRERSKMATNFDAGDDEFKVAKLPPDKGAAIVIYCNGPDCWKSFKASTAAVKAGYANVYWYREGFPDWKAKNLPIE